MLDVHIFLNFSSVLGGTGAKAGIPYQIQAALQGAVEQGSLGAGCKQAEGAGSGQEQIADSATGAGGHACAVLPARAAEQFKATDIGSQERR